MRRGGHNRAGVRLFQAVRPIHHFWLQQPRPRRKWIVNGVVFVWLALMTYAILGPGRDGTVTRNGVIVERSIDLGTEREWVWLEIVGTRPAPTPMQSTSPAPMSWTATFFWRGALAGLLFLVCHTVVAVYLHRRLTTAYPSFSHCGHCGYNLTGTAGATCPECGAQLRRACLLR